MELKDKILRIRDMVRKNIFNPRKSFLEQRFYNAKKFLHKENKNTRKFLNKEIHNTKRFITKEIKETEKFINKIQKLENYNNQQIPVQLFTTNIYPTTEIKQQHTHRNNYSSHTNIPILIFFLFISTTFLTICIKPLF